MFAAPALHTLPVNSWMPSVHRLLPSLLLPLVAVAALLWCGCNSQVHYAARPQLLCIDSIVPCLPRKGVETTLDTTSSSTTSAGSPYYFAISQVEGLNTAVDEFGVHFPVGRGATGQSALATVREGGKEDRLVRVSFSKVTEARVNAGGVQAQEYDGPLGSATNTTDGTLLVSAHRADRVRGDYDIVEGKIGPTTLQLKDRNDLNATVPWDAQPAFSPDGSIIYFASDRPGSTGASVDLWMSRRGADGAWSQPVNLGLGVNTPCDELSPWVSGDGRWLYFSSSGHQTAGGYDLFRAPILGEQVGTAQNLGAPINTPRDEIFPSAPANADPDTLLYYSSNQAGSKRFDIYTLHRERRAGRTTARGDGEVITLTGTVRDPQGRPVDGATVTIEERNGNPPRRDSTTTNREGRYQFPVVEGHEYEVVAGSDRTLYIREVVRIPIDGRKTINRDINLPDTVTFRVNFPFNDASNPYEYTLDDNGQPSDLKWIDMIGQAAEFLSKQNGTGARYQIVGHTDPVGSVPFNDGLGQRRADFIRRALIARGVAATILATQSQGERSPLAPRVGEEEELFHARLRRVVLIKVK